MKNRGNNINRCQTLDSFLRGNLTSQTNSRSKIKPKIKIPRSSGFASEVASIESPMLHYPLNPQYREYQQEIVINCICYNTLVCLPTGLGKTHIASILISNFIHWFPKGKIFFLAPTRPLVRQQRNSLKWFYQRLNDNLIYEMNGQISGQKRQKMYNEKQIFFGTPQTVENDIKQKRLDAKSIVLIIFDECHRAVGNSSYSQIMRMINTIDFGVRVVGLSATPGNEQQKIQEVIENLNISKLCYKDQNDLDVKKYLHQKNIIEQVINQTDLIKQTLQILESFIKPSLGLFIKFQLVPGWALKQGLHSSSFVIRQHFSKNIKSLNPKQRPLGYSALSIISFLISSKIALVDQGYETFKKHFFPRLISEKRNPNLKEQIDLENLSEQTITFQSKQISEDDKNSEKQYQTSKLPKNFVQTVVNSQKFKRLTELFYDSKLSVQHPKLQKLKKILEQFFKEQQNSERSKVIVFTQHRSSAMQIKQFLKGVQEIRCEVFCGQSKTIVYQNEFDDVGECSKTSHSVLQLKQRQQIELIEKYKTGVVNTLISTSIGEEGLDIGEVDCIICYDGGHSPIRQIQRRGRTGRKRAGKVYILLMEGKEMNDYKKGLAKQAKMKEILKKKQNKFNFYPYNSSLLPEHTQLPIIFYDNKQQSQLPPVQKQTKKIKSKKQKVQKKTKKRNIGADEELKLTQDSSNQSNNEVGDTISNRQSVSENDEASEQILGYYKDFDLISESFSQSFVISEENQFEKQSKVLFDIETSIQQDEKENLHSADKLNSNYYENQGDKSIQNETEVHLNLANQQTNQDDQWQVVESCQQLYRDRNKERILAQKKSILNEKIEEDLNDSLSSNQILQIFQNIKESNKYLVLPESAQ